MGLIFGPTAAATISLVAAKLRVETVRRYNEITNGNAVRYSPWMCLSIGLGRVAEDFGLCVLPYQMGHLVTDTTYLRKVEHLLLTHHERTRAQLIGTPSDWAVLEDDEFRPKFALDLSRAIDVCRGDPFLNAAVDAVLNQIIPLAQQRPRGWSSHYFRGTIFLGFPDAYSELDLSLDFIHEIGHQVLAIFQSVDPIFISSPTAPVYSEVRKTFRPAIQSLHALAAISFMTRLLKHVGRPDYTHPEFSYPIIEAHEKALGHLDRDCKFTEIGRHLLMDFEDMLRHA